MSHLGLVTYSAGFGTVEVEKTINFFENVEIPEPEFTTMEALKKLLNARQIEEMLAKLKEAGYKIDVTENIIELHW